MPPDADDAGPQEAALLTLLLAEAPIGFAFLDRGLRFRRVNAALARLNGHAAEAHLGRTVAEALGPKHAAALEPLLRRALGGESVLNAEVSTEEPGGARHFLVSYYPVHASGGIAGVGVIMEDVTERRRAEDARLDSERRFRAMFEHGSEAVCLTDGDGTVSYATPAIRRVLGYTPDEFAGVRAFDLIHPDDSDAIRRQAAGFVGEPGAVQTFRHRLRHKDRSWRLIEATSANLLNDPAVGALVANFRDITERDRAEEALQRAREDLETKVRERTGELAAANEALRAEAAERQQSQKARLELLQRLVSAQEDERRRIARDLHDGLGQHVTALSLGLKSLEGALPPGSPGADRLAGLLGLADVLGQEAHDLALRLRPTALDDWGLRAALQNDAAQWAERSGVPLDFHADGMDGERLPALLETTLYRVAQEALTNVARHAAPQHVSLILERRADHVLLIVEDDGRGFDTEATGGAGPDRRLGLLGMKERVAQIGGTLTVESAPGCGTTLFVRVPLEAS